MTHFENGNLLNRYRQGGMAMPKWPMGAKKKMRIVRTNETGATMQHAADFHRLKPKGPVRLLITTWEANRQ
jgi:hypothetical protein